MIVFGTRKLRYDIINICQRGAFGVHAGDPERYRGLDAYLWAIYHRHFSALRVTMQRLAKRLDSGDIVRSSSVPLGPAMRLYQLRRASSEAIADLVSGTIADLKDNGALTTRSQQRLGRYYSFMPSVLKDMCVRQFEKHTSHLWAQQNRQL